MLRRHSPAPVDDHDGLVDHHAGRHVDNQRIGYEGVVQADQGVAAGEDPTEHLRPSGSGRLPTA